MMGSNDYQYIKTGAIIGLVQTIVGHPLDTLKTNFQNNYSLKNIFKSDTPIIKKLYSGIFYPATINLVYNTCVYQLHHKLHQNNYSHFTSGCISGGLMGIVLNPFEYKKVIQQVDIKNKSINNTVINQVINQVINKKINKSKPFFIGLKYTMLRESLSTGIYFSTYFYLKEEKKKSVFHSGGLAGIYSWLFTYPIDTYKTRIQINPHYSMNLFEKVEKNNRSFIHLVNYVNIKPITSLWSGLFFCLTRAYIVNGLGFTIYNYFTEIEE
jgi:solute carrier family 25 (mitochondrial carnitine/acylcarnitine transporter), member 20/29